MLYQIASDYKSIGDTESMTLGRIVFWYNGMRGQLREATKKTDRPRKKR